LVNLDNARYDRPSAPVMTTLMHTAIVIGKPTGIAANKDERDIEGLPLLPKHSCARLGRQATG
jgi:hypothetical protein